MNKNDRYTLFDFIDLIWRRKWFILLPTLAFTFLAGLFSLALPKVWDIDAMIVPGKFLVFTELGEFDTVLVNTPQQVAEEIKGGSYTYQISSELSVDMEKMPPIKAEAIKDTNLVRVFIRHHDIELSKKILNSLFNLIKNDLDTKVNVQIKEIDTQIESYKRQIEEKKINIKDVKNDITLKEIDKRKIRQQTKTVQNKITISQTRESNLIEEMKEIKARIEKIEKHQQQVLEKNDPNNALSLLLYSNEVQLNFRYYNMLDEKLSNEKISQENLELEIKTNEEDSNSIDTIIEKLNNETERIQNAIYEMENTIEFFGEKKNRFDFTQFIKEPQKSLYPSFPRVKFNVVIVFLFSLVLFTFLAFFLEYFNKIKKTRL